MTMGSDEWSTPQWLFDALDREFRFVLDACASHENHKCKHYFTIEDDALIQDWHPFKRVWMNPPYDSMSVRGRLTKWVEKAHNEARKQCVVVCLLPASTSTRWWHDHVLRGRVRYIKGRLKYSDGKGQASFSSAIVIFSTWHMLVRSAMETLGGRGHIRDLYALIRSRIDCRTNRHVRAKIRQILQMHNFISHGAGEWGLA